MDGGVCNSRAHFFHLSSKSSNGYFPELHRATCVRPSNRMVYIRLFRGILSTLWIQYCLHHVPGSFCYLSHYLEPLCPSSVLSSCGYLECQLVIRSSPRKTSLGMGSLWPNPLLNGLLSQIGIHWRYLTKGFSTSKEHEVDSLNMKNGRVALASLQSFP